MVWRIYGKSFGCDTLSWDKIWQLNGFNRDRSKQNLLRKQKSQMEFLEPTRKPKVIYTDNSLKFGKACEDLSWNHCTSAPHRSETNGIAERAVRRTGRDFFGAVAVQSCCNQVWVKNGGRILWSVTAICETFKISCLMGKHFPNAIRRTIQRTNYSIWCNGRMSPYLCERQIETTAIWSKRLARYSLDMRCTRWESGKETLWSQTLKNWRRWTHQKSTPEGSLQRKC